METRKYLFETLWRQFLTEDQSITLTPAQFKTEMTSILQAMKKNPNIVFVHGDETKLEAIGNKPKIIKYVSNNAKPGGPTSVTIKKPGEIFVSGKQSADTYETYTGV
jgi:hypothetical protein